MGRRLANRDEIDWLRRPSKRPERFIRDVKASKGILMPDMIAESCVGGGEGCPGTSGSMRCC